MQTMESRWTDDRMDDLSGKVGGLDHKVDGLGQRIGRLEHTVDEMNREMHAEFRAVRGEMRMMQATMIGGFVTLFATMVGLLATQL